MSGSGVAVVDIRKVVPQNSQVAKSFFRDAAERVPPQLGQLSAFMLRLYDKVGQILDTPQFAALQNWQKDLTQRRKDAKKKH